VYFTEKKATIVLHSQVVTDDDKFPATRRDDLLLCKTTAAALDEVHVFIDLVSTINPNINLHNHTINFSFFVRHPNKTTFKSRADYLQIYWQRTPSCETPADMQYQDFFAPVTMTLILRP